MVIHRIGRSHCKKIGNEVNNKIGEEARYKKREREREQIQFKAGFGLK